MLLPARTLRTSMVIAATAVAAIVGLTGCGSGDKSDAKATSTTSAAAPTSATGHGDHGSAAAPTAETLIAVLDTFSDPAKPTSEKTKLIVDGEKRIANINQMNQTLGGYGKLTYAVADITTSGNSATAQVTITSPHGTVPAMPMTWEHVDSTWKLSDASGCLMLGFAQAPCAPA
ncbi:hypothetical protein AB0L63_05540 [Nocardia sp. NPDC051990]|uniref:hypothetical protein n=1 Tax=Nocardia sp. NPDC051990 TaxID=3155285 RepID=UPI00343BA5A4